MDKDVPSDIEDLDATHDSHASVGVPWYVPGVMGGPGKALRQVDGQPSPEQALAVIPGTAGIALAVFGNSPPVELTGITNEIIQCKVPGTRPAPMAGIQKKPAMKERDEEEEEEEEQEAAPKDCSKLHAPYSILHIQ